jgi:peroxiredoxin
MAQLGPWKKTIDAFGGGLVFIAAEKRSGMFNPEKFLEEHPTPFPFLLDEDRAVTKAYGVYHRLGIDAINIAHPATFVIGRDGTIRYQYVGATQVDRAPIEEVLDAFKRAASE